MLSAALCRVSRRPLLGEMLRVGEQQGQKGKGEERELRRGSTEKLKLLSVCSVPEPKACATNCFFLHACPRERPN